MKINKFVILVFVFITTVFAEKSMAQVFGNRTKYKIHEVKQKETVYGISKMYDLTIDELYKHNPDAKKGLLIGDRLLIPEKKRSRNSQDEDKIGEYTIQPKETLYSLSKKFEMSISKLIELNPALRMGPKVGQVIKIPANLIVEDTTGLQVDSIKISLNTDSIDLLELQVPRIIKPLKPKYKVAILLPLFLEENDTIMVYNDSPKELIYQKSEIGVDVLMGIECAIDSLKKLGLSLDVYLLDTKNRPERCVQLARSPLIKSMDLIIGPLFSKNLKPVAGLLNRDSVQVLNLFSKNLELVNTYANVWQCTPSEREETAALVKYINANCPKRNVVLIRQDNPSQKLWADYARKHLMQRDSLDTLSIREIVADSAMLAVIDSSHFLLDEDNVVLSLSNDKVFVTDVVSKLNVLRMKNIQLFGFSDIYELNSPDYGYLMHLRAIVASPFFIDVHDQELLRFYKTFKAKNKQEPSKFALMAYDMSFHAMYHMLKYGSIYGSYGQNDTIGLGMQFKYLSGQKGKLNTKVYLLEYKDYNILPIIEAIPEPLPVVVEEKPIAIPAPKNNEFNRLKGISFD